jgi:DUF1680 family protein
MNHQVTKSTKRSSSSLGFSPGRGLSLKTLGRDVQATADAKNQKLLRVLRGFVVLSALFICLTACTGAAMAQQKLTQVPLKNVKLTGGFWGARMQTNRQATIWHDFDECERTGRIANFKRAAGLEKGPHVGLFFNDSDVYKVMEAAAYSLENHPDPKLDAYLDNLISIMARAQQPDGYLYTLYILETPEKRFTNLKDMHELYCAGHLIEAGVAHYQATGKRSLLDVAIKCADHIDSIFGPGKRIGVPGHEEIELALFRLADCTGQAKYRKLAEFFLAQRGAADRTHYGEYYQDVKPLAQFDEVVGHAVRQMYLACAMTDECDSGDEEFRPALNRMWNDMTSGKLYITGGVGARHAGEAFGTPYELPNESAYAETCAGIGNALWNQRMNELTGDARYADLVERVTYNGMLSGVSLSGDKFFYVNPLASRGNHHRQNWYECACCPPNVARYIATMPQRVYAVRDGEIYVNLYASSIATLKLPHGTVKLTQDTRYPWDGKVRFTIDGDAPAISAIHLRLPEWTGGKGISLNGKPVAMKEASNGYLVLRDGWKSGDSIELDLDMPIRRVYADPRVKDDTGRVAVQRGPIVYCAEAVDNDGAVANVILPKDSELASEYRADLLGGVTVIQAKALAKTSEAGQTKPIDLTLVPYYAWDNRAPGAMAVWLAEDPAVAQAPPTPTIASRSRPSASGGVGQDSISALNDQIEPKSSHDEAIPRFTWWPAKGQTEWLQYDFAQPATVSAVEVYWFDDVPPGGCHVPQSWSILYKDGDQWKPVKATSEYGTKKDQYNRATFEPVKTSALRIKAKLQEGYSAGVLEWRVE